MKENEKTHEIPSTPKEMKEMLVKREHESKSKKRQSSLIAIPKQKFVIENKENIRYWANVEHENAKEYQAESRNQSKMK